MQHRTQSADVVVIGGGLAGVSAAVAAARLGSRVSLVTNRPVLGGNSSSEVRVWVVGATAHGHQRFARETGIMGELFLENQYRNPEGNPFYWDQTVLDLVRAEPNLQLHLNTDVRIVTMAEGAEGVASPTPRIASVTGWTMGSEIETEFVAPVFIDCTGDGLVGHLAGATSRIGREGRAELGEPWAPEVADDELLGSSIFFYTKDTGRPERFVAPDIARDIRDTPILTNRIIRTGDNGCNYWWIEWGGELDTVAENEQIRDELWSVVFGIWDYIKNSGEFDADTLTLEWVGSIPGKREYRRLLGDHTLTQNDLLDQVDFEDTVAFGGWSIDLHPVEGVYAETAGAQQRFSNGTYGIPFRSLYSHDVDNLLFAGRNISASHVAFGSTRVMATCATQGQAVGTAAALIARHGLTPRELAGQALPLLQRTLLREDAPVIGITTDDPDDLAGRATVSASSALSAISTLEHLGSGERFTLDRDVAILVPVAPSLDQITLLVDAARDATLRVELWSTGKRQNAVPVEHLLDGAVEIAAGLGVPATVRFGWTPDVEQNAVLVVRANPDVSLLLTEGHPYGLLVLTAKHASDEVFDDHIPEEQDQAILDWNARKLRGRSVALTVGGDTTAYRPERIVDGYQRPYGGPHLWSSERLDDNRDLVAEPEVLTLHWDEPVDVASVRIVFNDDVDVDLINLHHHRTDFEAVPELVAAYRLEARPAGAPEGTWTVLAEVEGNRHRHRIHDVEPVRVDALRVVVTATNGSPYVSVASVKVFEQPSGRTTRPRRARPLR
ncbi:FAD-dependent oxidoreductase [Plantibacter sp. CFBP 8775]|uniref:FAD-dependent oxidoreductase n=1 Tax=Plantibacter sp. CFBP 8775 TaxID=2774038 RepID=UPI001781AA77|nr:FAD-dependent oxidoreductase [Plantibacter sp. CFBP 8775]MBD8101027.1 FAD-dependent oxidoreductase [Plantibacter sp. CFBP 8775]